MGCEMSPAAWWKLKMRKAGNWTHHRRWPYPRPLRSDPYGPLQTSAWLFASLSPATWSLFWTVLAVHFTPSTICHSFCRSLDVILRLLSDNWMNWRLPRSVESRFRPLTVCSFVVLDVCCLTLFLWTSGIHFQDRSNLTLTVSLCQ